MVEPLRPVMDRDEDSVNYKPLSLMSVAAFAVAAFFCALVVVLTIVGLATRRPVLEPWLIGLAVIGVMLAVVARWQIAMSEGTRGGQRLASIAWWFSVVGGCVYGAYYGGNVLAIQRQATSFVADNYLQTLKGGEIDKAYFWTVEPAMRKGMLVSDITKRFGDVFTPFRQERVPRLILRAGEKASFEPQGILDWNQGVEGLEVTTRHRLYTPEGEFELIVQILGTENRETGAREWHVDRKKTGISPLYFTNYGIALDNLQKEADTFLFEWIHDMRMGTRRAEMYLATQPLTVEERRTKYRDFLGKAVVTPFVAPMLADMLRFPDSLRIPTALFSRFNPEGAVDQHFPEASSAAMGKALVKWDESKQKRTAAEKEQMLPLMLQSNYLNTAMAPNNNSDASTFLEVTPQGVKATMALSVSLPVLKYRSIGKLVAVCEDPAFAAALVKLAEQPRVAGTPDEVRDLWLSSSTPHTWRIKEIIVDLARDATDMRPTQPSSVSGPMGPTPGH